MHDCFSSNQAVTLEALGLIEKGKMSEAIDNNQLTYGGKIVVSPSGGLLGRGNPTGCTGLT